MRIPLDYYRVLGLPIQATDEQLQQAHRDRGLQLPRREYSEAAIAARKDLIDEAYNVISNPEERQAYDAGFLARSYGINAALLEESGSAAQAEPAIDDPAAAYTPTIEIEADQLIGALVILQELGEYELVIRLGRPYLSSGNQVLEGGRYGESADIFPDLVLTVALACLDLGREQWQQGRYENAAESLETGRELLQRERLFDTLGAEIKADLYKLRPYQILELLALPETRLNQRHKGLQMLQTMLQERGGIDGNGNDRSGLDIDDFLRFIQQLRSYLTAAEQQSLFEAEARRPSPVANYLAVYALLARGFAQKQPNWIRRAKQMLGRLSDRQDVHLEQAVCALLLGQTEAASHALELSQEYEPLAFIREHSQGSTDLLPGLCLYAERWLQQEVFPHFRDLANLSASLRHYFADEHVQAYLEALPAQDLDTMADTPTASAPAAPPMASWGHPAAEPVATEPLAGDIRDWRTRDLTQPAAPAAMSARSTPAHYPPQAQPTPAYPPDQAAPNPRLVAQAGAVNVPEFDEYEAGFPDAVAAPPAPLGIPYPEETPAVEEWEVDDPAIAPTSPAPEPTAAYVARLSPDGQLSPSRRNGKAGQSASRPATQRPEPTAVATRTRATAPTAPAPRSRSARPGQRRGSSLHVGRLSLVVACGLLALGGLGFGLSRLVKAVGSWGTPALSGDQLELGIDQLPIEIPTATEPPNLSESQGLPQGLTVEQAEAAIQGWFTAKQAAFGPDYNIDALNSILTDPLLAEKRDRAATAQSEGWYWGYTHEILSVDLVPTDNPTTAIVEAEVREQGDYYRNNLMDSSESYDSTLKVQYSLVNTPEGWRIQEMSVE